MAERTFDDIFFMPNYFDIANSVWPPIAKTSHIILPGMPSSLSKMTRVIPYLQPLLESEKEWYSALFRVAALSSKFLSIEIGICHFYLTQLGTRPADEVWRDTAKLARSFTTCAGPRRPLKVRPSIVRLRGREA
jgi:hypothetical protein